MKKINLIALATAAAIGFNSNAYATAHVSPSFDGAGGWVATIGNPGLIFGDIQPALQAAINNLQFVAEDHAVQIERIDAQLVATNKQANFATEAIWGKPEVIDDDPMSDTFGEVIEPAVPGLLNGNPSLGLGEGLFTKAQNDISDLQTALGDGDVSTGNYTSGSADLTAAILDVDAQVKTNADNIASLDTTIGDGDVSTGNYTSGSADLTAAILDVDAQVKTNTTNITGLRSEVDDLNSIIRLDASGKIHIGTDSFTFGTTDSDFSYFAGPGETNEEAINFTMTPTVNGVDVATVTETGDLDYATAGAVNSNVTGNLTQAIAAVDSNVGEVSTLGATAGADTNIVAGTNNTVAAINTLDANMGDVSAIRAEINSGTLVGSLNNMYDYSKSEFGRLDNRIDGLASRIDGINDRIDSVSVELRSSIAGMSAMSALVPNARAKGNTQLSFGAGTYRDQYGIAAGAFHYVNDNVLLNVGGSYSHDNFAGRVGITIGW